MHYILIDTANSYFRARHAAHRAADDWQKVGYALHVTLASVNAVARRFQPDHVVFALEGRSWRKDWYEPYKRNRAVARAALTEAEQEQDRMFWEAYDEFTKFLAEKTNTSVIRHPEAEADDVIARFIALHPEDQHTIVSSDTDYVQLLAENVQQYNGITDELITISGILDRKGNPVVDKKTKAAKTPPDPQWLLFEKCMRGDPTDNVFSAYPGVRTRGTKSKVGLMEAYADRTTQGFNYNNLMLQRWVDHEGREHRVKDDYERNRTLIDLTAQPADIKAKVDTAIREQVRREDQGQVGMKFMKFCAKYELVKISESAEQYAQWLNVSYAGGLEKISSTGSNDN